MSEPKKHLNKASEGEETAQQDSGFVVEKSLVVEGLPGSKKNTETTPEVQDSMPTSVHVKEKKRAEEEHEGDEDIDLNNDDDSPSPGAFAVGGNVSPLPPDASPSDEATMSPSPPLPVEATLVPPLVTAVAVAAPDHPTTPQNEIDKMIRTVVAEERSRTQSKVLKTWCSVGIVLVLVAGVVLGVVLGLQGGDDSSNSATLTSTPVARCRNDTLVIPVESCRLNRLLPDFLDNGSSGRNITLRVDPFGPYSIGSHNVTLEVMDDQGRWDVCSANIVVVDNITEWKSIRNHSYRIRGCKREWAEAVSEIGSLCGARGHLATITSVEERDFVRDMVEGLALGNDVFWLGGSQPPNPEDVRSNWTWVNGEGLIYDGYVDWHVGEPSRASENCLVMTGRNKAFEWEDKSCFNNYRYIEEYELDGTVHVDGCDSGVPDTLADPGSCTFAITLGISKACGSRESNPRFGACLSSYLTTLVSDGDLSVLGKEKIVNCGSNNTSPVAVCQDVVEVEVAPSLSSTEPVVVQAFDFDSGSFDPDGDLIRLEIEPEGPYELGVTDITLLVFDGRGGSDNCQSTLNITDGNLAPVARCKELVEVSTTSGCSGKVEVEQSDLDDGSFDPEGGPISFSISPSGSFSVGVHNVTMRVSDQWGASHDCETTVIVKTSEPVVSTWAIFENHAYRVQLCRVNWESARTFAGMASVCGGLGHLATIASTAERDFVRDVARSQSLGNSEFWLGGFQPPDADEPKGGWSWVNDEGLIFDGYLDWDDGEPNRSQEDCMVMLGPSRGNRWDDRPCSNTFRYIEEVDLDRTVNIGGCDSGVPDKLIDVESCRYVIADGISDCRNSEDAGESFAACTDGYLTSLVEARTLTADQRNSIGVCAGIP